MRTGVRSTFASVAAWTAGAAASVGVGLLALSLIDGGLTTRPAQSSIPDVGVGVGVASPARSTVQSGGSAGLTTSSAVPRTSPATDAQGADQVLSSPGGTAVARCGVSGAYLVSWSPAQGYRVGEVRRGPASEARVVFAFHAGIRMVDLRVTCMAGVPQSKIVRGRGGP